MLPSGHSCTKLEVTVETVGEATLLNSSYWRTMLKKILSFHSILCMSFNVKLINSILEHVPHSDTEQEWRHIFSHLDYSIM